MTTQTTFYKGFIEETGSFNRCLLILELEDNIVIKQTLHRRVISPLENYSDEIQIIKDICDDMFTPEIKAEYQLFLDSMEV